MSLVLSCTSHRAMSIEVRHDRHVGAEANRIIRLGPSRYTMVLDMGKGLFATSDLKKGQVVAFFCGFAVKKTTWDAFLDEYENQNMLPTSCTHYPLSGTHCEFYTPTYVWRDVQYTVVPLNEECIPKKPLDGKKAEDWLRQNLLVRKKDGNPTPNFGRCDVSTDDTGSKVEGTNYLASNAGHMINEPPIGKSPNTSFHDSVLLNKIKRLHTIVPEAYINIIASRDIRAGEELFVCYSKSSADWNREYPFNKECEVSL